MHVVTTGHSGAEDRLGNLGHAHVVGGLDLARVTRIDDRSVSSHVAVVRHGNRSSTLRNVTTSQAHGTESTDKATETVMGSSRVGHAASSNIMSTLSGDISMAHTVAALVVMVVGSHSGRIVVRHGHFLRARS